MSNKSTNTRKRILQATWDLLETNQGKGVRMSDIAKHANVSRQALYLHFTARADLLIATTLYIDEINAIDERLVASRTATTGAARLDAFVETWANYIPEIYAVCRALLSMKDSDEAAAAAWDNRMLAVRHGCAAAINTLVQDRNLSSDFTSKEAIDFLWTLLSIRNWEQLLHGCGWSQANYVSHVKNISQQLFVAEKQ